MAFVIQLISLILLGGSAIKSAENTSWKLANTGIVVGSMLVGTVFALIFAYFVHAGEIGILDTLPFALFVGMGGAAGTIAGNKWRAGGIRKGRRAQYPPSDKTVI